jgi:hypothetical protein
MNKEQKNIVHRISKVEVREGTSGMTKEQGKVKVKRDL